MTLPVLCKAACHCGAVQFTLKLPQGLVELRRCSCSLCRMRGAVTATVALEDLHVTAGADKLGLYQFNTRTAKHYFCSVCGIYTHHQRRSNMQQYGFNVACIAEVDPFALGDIPVYDGKNHPMDRSDAGNA
jgi:hypothetical protein